MGTPAPVAPSPPSSNHWRTTESRVGRDPEDHLRQPFTAKAGDLGWGKEGV